VPDTSPFELLRAAGAEILNNPYGRKLTKDELLELLPGVDAIIAGLEPLTREVLERSSLRVISRCGSGMSNVDLQAAEELKIVLRSTPDAPTAAVAELTVGALITLLRHVRRMDEDLHQGKWSKRIGLQVEGRTVAVIGFGRIGRRVGALLKAFGARVIAVDAAYSGNVDGFEVALLDRALREADVITLHASGNSEIIGAEQLAAAKDGVFILNAARGELLNEEALIAGLRSGRVAGAWLDVFRDEPYAGPLIQFPQVLLTPHIGSGTAECRTRMEVEAVKNLLAVMQ
jgi:D-3-phosphoglycerate dehydrogenase